MGRELHLAVRWLHEAFRGQVRKKAFKVQVRTSKYSLMCEGYILGPPRPLEIFGCSSRGVASELTIMIKDGSMRIRGSHSVPTLASLRLFEKA